MSGSEEMQKYFDVLNSELQKTYGIAQQARQAGIDPESHVDIFLARSVAEKVQALVSSVAPQLKESKLSEAITELEKEFGAGDWRVALKIARAVAEQKFCQFAELREAIEVGIRTGLAYLTMGSVSAPLEGFVELKFKKRLDGKDYIAIYFAGPIRGAGGSAQAVTVLIADYLRKSSNIAEYDITNEEVKRYQVELDDYLSKIAHRQYKPTAGETEMLVRNIKVEVTGDPTEVYEVSQCKRLPRVETDIIRGGMALVMTEGLSLKAEKLWKQLSKWGKDFGLEDWTWLKDFIALKARLHAGEAKELELTPVDSYLTDIVAGRPILSYPMEKGGFRLRYGRARATGLAAMAINPATMVVLNNYIAVGTQIKTERPGKATVFTVCDSIDGPIVKLKNGSVVKLDNFADANSVKNEVEEILFLGDLLVSCGDWSETGQRLAPAGYCEEWWDLEVKSITEQTPLKLENAKAAIEFAEKAKMPLHPKWTYYWKDISQVQFIILSNWAQKLDGNILPLEQEPKKILELIGCPHTIDDNKVVLSEDNAYVLNFLLKNRASPSGKNGLDCINSISPVQIKDKSGTYIGTRMGRPEKAKLRVMKGSPAALFPVGREGGRFRSINEAINQKEILTDAPIFFCQACNKITVYPKCEICSKATEAWRICPLCKKKTKKLKCHTKTLGYERRKINVEDYTKLALQQLQMPQLPPLVKGVKGTWNKDRIFENLAKGILRAKHNLTVNKDGTIRFDGTQLPITHFKPKEIGTSIEKLKQLGYQTDINGRELANEDQILELKPQDIILPECPNSPDEGSAKVFLRICAFIDELLEKVYKLPKFYNAKTREDLIGHIFIGLAPHTSCGITSRLIGFSQAQGIYAHPYWHAATRRNCDGDEVAVILALDAFLNFSRQYLPDRRGGRNMDAPLVLTTILDPREVDTEAHNLDVASNYPLEFYQVAQKYGWPWEVKVEHVKDRLGKPEQYYNLLYTHETSDINAGVLCSAYKTIPTMLEKLAGQLELASKIRAVNMEGVAALVIDKHFLRDIKGNLRKFTTQEFRCVSCNTKYRRPPLQGTCTECGGKLLFTVAEGTIRKYLEAALQLAAMPKMPPYMQQTLEILKRRIDSIFLKEATKQIGLKTWFQ